MSGGLRVGGAVQPPGSVFTDLGPFYGPFGDFGSFLGLFFFKKSVFFTKKMIQMLVLVITF